MSALLSKCGLELLLHAKVELGLCMFGLGNLTLPTVEFVKWRVEGVFQLLLRMLCRRKHGCTGKIYILRGDIERLLGISHSKFKVCKIRLAYDVLVEGSIKSRLLVEEWSRLVIVKGSSSVDQSRVLLVRHEISETYERGCKLLPRSHHWGKRHFRLIFRVLGFAFGLE